MWKNLGTAAAVLVVCAGLCVGLTGCSGSREYGELKAAQEAVLRLTSGKLLLTAGYEKPDSADQIVTEFAFRQMDGGTYAYCQTQFDRNNKPVFCEYSNGQTTGQWLIGRGWSDVAIPPYTPDNPHRYLQILSTPPDRKAVRKITTSDESGSRRYDVTLDPARLNKTVYTDETGELLEEHLQLQIDKTGQLLSYSDEARIREPESDGDARYTLEIHLSDCNTLSEIPRPEFQN